MAHFLKNADPPVSEAVVALIDPDMILMSPLTPNVGERGRRGGGAVEESERVEQIVDRGGKREREREITTTVLYIIVLFLLCFFLFRAPSLRQIRPSVLALSART